MIMEADSIGRLVGGAHRCAPAHLGYTGQLLKGVEGLQVTAYHPNTEIIAGNGLIATLKTQSSEAVIQGCSAIVAERVDGPPGEHDVFVEVDPNGFSIFGVHCYTLKLSRACRVS